ncbi:MAG: nucleotidyltransferase domain-containing protein [Patescibacteria group bacterium]
MNDFIDLPPGADLSIAKKWNKLLRRARLFTFIPFIEIVFVAGSMAMGTAGKDSDFDVIVGVRTGRIFTVRAFCVLFFGLLGWRRRNYSHYVRDKFCFSHFIAPEKYSLSGPYNEYWKKLYLSLVPIYGNSKQIQKFYDANAGWTGCRRHSALACPAMAVDAESRIKDWIPVFAGMTKNPITKIKEKILSGKLGNFLEKCLKNIQIKKIEKSLKTVKQYKPRNIFNDSELEFHPDTKRAEEFYFKP